MSTKTLPSRIVRPGEAIVYDQLQGEKIHFLLSGQDTAGALALFIDETPPGAGPPLHVHRNEDETFYVLEGELEIQVNEERFTAPAGSTAFLPRGIPHSFANLGTQTARSLVVLTPAGLEGFFAEVEPLVTQAEPDMAAVFPIAAKYGIEVAGPPLAATMEHA
jgi:quercetin dioxygenase-like cupin family protein